MFLQGVAALMEVISFAPAACAATSSSVGLGKPLRSSVVAGGAASKPPRPFEPGVSSRKGGKKRPPALSPMACPGKGEEVQSFSMSTPRGEEAGRHFIGTPTANGIMNAFLDFDDIDLEGGPPLDFNEDDLARLVTTGVSACELDCGNASSDLPGVVSPSDCSESVPPTAHRANEASSAVPFPSLTSGGSVSRRRRRQCEEAEDRVLISEDLKVALSAISDEASAHRETQPTCVSAKPVMQDISTAVDDCDVEYDDDFEEYDSEAESDSGIVDKSRP